ncbi:MAG TPA: DUF6220 domain-containing protein [Candidatus Dormibacteraeota bacterium]|jgi:hypothetical protein
MLKLWLRYAHLVFGWLFLASLVYQVYLIGLHLFAGTSTQAHIEFGYSWPGFLALLVVVSAIAARLPVGAIGWSAALFVDYIVQTFLPGFRADSPQVAALHPVNALLLFWLAIVVIREARSFVPAPLGVAQAEA